MAGTIKTEQTNAAQIENEAVAANRTLLRKRDPNQVWVGPGGILHEVRPHTAVSYNLNAEADLLGAPEKILTDDWKREHVGWRYAWPIRQSPRTSAFIRAGWYVPVPFDAVDSFNPMAAVAEIKTPAGTYIVWMQHILVAVPPHAWDATVGAYEHMATERAMNRPAAVAADLASTFKDQAVVQESRFRNKAANKTGGGDTPD